MTVVYIDSVFVLNGLMDYLLLLCAGRLAGLSLRRKRYALILPQLPSILTVAVLLLSPVSGSYRYAMPMAYAIPFLLAAGLLPVWRGRGGPEGAPPAVNPTAQ